MDASVIIPTYNRPELLRQQLVCLAGQNGGFVREVIVCDDGSSTDTRETLRPFFSRIPDLILLQQEDLGFRAGQARNLGIRSARGDVLIFTDDDVLVPGDFVRNHVMAHSRSGNGAPTRQIVLGFRYRTGTQPDRLPPTADEILACVADNRVEQLGMHGENVGACGHPWYYVYSCNFSVRNEPDRVTFDERFVGWGMEDTELGYRLVREGYTITVEPRACVLHVESRQPRDPFICEERGLPPRYDSYVRNMVRFASKYPDDRELQQVLRADLRWYVRDDTGRHWIKDGHEHDANAVVAEERRALGAEASSANDREPRPAPQKSV